MMVCKVNLSFLFGFLKLWVQSLRLGMASACLATAICRLGKGLASGQTHKDSVRMAFLSGGRAIQLEVNNRKKQ
eukprot:scaffold291463_cov13-Tisochrysis_lutea.AAC.1